MIFKFSEFLHLNYQVLQAFVGEDEEITKEELLERCAGEIEYELLQSLKELSFRKIGKKVNRDLFVV